MTINWQHILFENYWQRNWTYHFRPLREQPIVFQYIFLIFLLYLGTFPYIFSFRKFRKFPDFEKMESAQISHFQDLVFFHFCFFVFFLQKNIFENIFWWKTKNGKSAAKICHARPDAKMTFNFPCPNSSGMENLVGNLDQSVALGFVCFLTFLPFRGFVRVLLSKKLRQLPEVFLDS